MLGLDVVPIEVEVDVASRGLPSLSIVGLPDKAVQESRERVRSALINSGAEIPARRITINLAPAHLPKEGPAYDLPIAVGLLMASEAIAADVRNALFFGELSLDGTLRHTVGVLPLVLMAKEHGISEVFIPADNAHEARVVTGVRIYPVASLKELVAHLTEIVSIDPLEPEDISRLLARAKAPVDMQDVLGQETAKRALEIAAAGAHNVLLHGLPGAGKTLMSRAFVGILPRLTEDESLEISKIFSVSGLLDANQSLVTTRQFRSPHHTTSQVGLIGGGTRPKPGEISLAHRGVLFLDEFPEFSRTILESLRQPLEDGYVHIARASLSAKYPCRFILVAAANPCPCGFLGSPVKSCVCTGSQIQRYRKKISGPMLDRIDLHVHVPAVDVKKLASYRGTAESSDVIQQRVQNARNIQQDRFINDGIQANAEMSSQHVKQYVELDAASLSYLTNATARLGLSARGYFKTLKVARTIADLALAARVTREHLAEALQYRHRELLTQ